MDALFLPLANAVGASVDQIKARLERNIITASWILTRRLFHFDSSFFVCWWRTLWEACSFAFLPPNPICAIFLIPVLPSCSSSRCSRYILRFSNCWVAFWRHMLLQNMIRARGCRGLFLGAHHVFFSSFSLRWTWPNCVASLWDTWLSSMFRYLSLWSRAAE